MKAQVKTIKKISEAMNVLRANFDKDATFSYDDTNEVITIYVGRTKVYTSMHFDKILVFTRGSSKTKLALGSKVLDFFKNQEYVNIIDRVLS